LMRSDACGSTAREQNGQPQQQYQLSSSLQLSLDAPASRPTHWASCCCSAHV
jgi:hypothetical protein